MTEDQFDELLRNMFRDHRSTVPENMWERIIQKKNKDRKGFIFFFRPFGIPVLVVALSLGGYLLFDNNKDFSVGKKEITNKNILPLPDSTNSEPASRNSRNILFRQNQVIGHYIKKDKNKKTVDETTLKTKEKLSNMREIIAPVDKKDERKSIDAHSDSLAMGNNTTTMQINRSVKKPVNKLSSMDSTENISSKKPETNKSLNSKKWYLDFYASPDIPIYNQSATSSNDQFDEEMKLSFSIGLRINRSFGKHFSGKMGIQFSKLNFVVIDSVGHHKNHLKSFDIPVLAGYSFGNEKFKLTLNAGVVLNLYSWYEGSSETDFFKTNTGWSLYAGLNFTTEINEKVSIFGEPYFRYRLSSMTVSSVDFNKFIDVAGFSLGVRYHFSK